MPSLSRLPLLTLLVVIVGASAHLLALDGPYYANCPICATKLGGQGFIGPYDTFPECDAERKIEISQGKPIGPCTTSHTISPGRPSAAGSVVKFTSLGALAGATWGGVQGYGGDEEMARTVYGGLIGGGAGAAIGAALNAPALSPVAAAVLIGGGTAAAVAGYGRNRELDGLQQSDTTNKNALIVGGAVAVVVFTIDEVVGHSIMPGVHLPKGMHVSVTGRQVWMRWLW